MNALLLALAAVVSPTSESTAAVLDRAQFPPDRAASLYYVTTALAEPAARVELERAMRLVVPSASRQQILERCVPVKVTETLWRLDLADLQWPLAEWRRFVARYPYNPAGTANPLIVRADWLVLNLSDEQAADGYYGLLFGRRPATRDEALALVGVPKADPLLTFGMIEGQSGVSKARRRWMENRPAARGFVWGTRDSVEINAQSDPLEHPTGDFTHDGEEWIIGLPKVHLASGTRGVLQAYFLANGQGRIVDRAPVDLVEDWTMFRGLREIRNPGSCIQCHPGGLNFPTRNELRDTLESGVELQALYPKNEQIEAFHLADVVKEIKRSNEDFEAIVRLACECSPVEASNAFQAACDRYLDPVTVEAAAREAHIEPAELRLALAWASKHGYDLGPNIALLAHGRSCPREAFEDRYRDFRMVVEQWRAGK